MARPSDLAKRLADVQLSEIDTQAASDLFRGVSLLPLYAIAAREAHHVKNAEGEARAEDRFRETARAVRPVAADLISRNKYVLPRIVEAFEGFAFAEHSSWLAGVPTIRTGMLFELGVSSEKQTSCWEFVGKTFGESGARFGNADELASLMQIEMFQKEAIEPGWAVLSPFNWTKFAGETAIALGSLEVAAAAIVGNIYLLIPAGVLLIGGACLKQLGEQGDR